MTEIEPTDFPSQCVLTKSRRAARAVSRHFGKLLEPHGITASQASTMFVLHFSEKKSISALADFMGLERSGLTRNLKLLETQKYVECDVSGRGGAKGYRLSKLGAAKLQNMIPLWHAAQDSVRQQLGVAQWDNMQASLAALADL